MENVADALILAFAVMIFTIALTLSMSVFSQARQTSDIVLSTVESNMKTEYEDLSSLSKLSYRKVGMETIVPTLYRYYKENLTVVFLQGNLDESDPSNPTITAIDTLPIYTSQTLERSWGTSYTGRTDLINPANSIRPSYGFNLNGSDHKQICVFDINEENARGEPFSSDDTNRKKNMDAILNGESIDYPYRGTVTYNYALNNPLINKKAKYLELVSREDKSTLGGNKTTRKTIITYIKYADS